MKLIFVGIVLLLVSACSNRSSAPPLPVNAPNSLISSTEDSQGWQWEIHKSPLTGDCYEFVYQAGYVRPGLTISRLVVCP